MCFTTKCKKAKKTLQSEMEESSVTRVSLPLFYVIICYFLIWLMFIYSAQNDVAEMHIYICSGRVAI